MLPLPHPHGSASGQIGNNAFYDTGSTPGSSGGKFIGFGEEGTSAVANRAHWALSENCDFLYQKLAVELAMPEIASWTVAVGAGAQYTFLSTPDVWCGDGSYPSGQEGLDRLFSLLDNEYNQLTDPSDGSKVVVRTVRSAMDVDLFGSGFNATPIIKFKTVDPVTGVDVTNPYTIPNGTVVKVIHARKSSLGDLTTDAFTKLPIRVAEEVPAGVVLQDGTRPMTGDLNLDANSLVNLVGLSSESGSDVTFSGYAGTETLNLTNWQDVNFADARVGIMLSGDDQPVTLGTNGSIYGALSNSWLLGKALHGNRLLAKGGSIVFTDGTGNVNWPTMEVILNGDRRFVGSGNVTAPSGAARVLVIDSAGAVTQRVPAAVVGTDLPLAYYTWSGTAFTTKLDVRWPVTSRSTGMEVTVGADSGGTILPGCDFADLESAVALSRVMQVTGSMGQSYTIKLRGTVAVPNSIYMTANVRIIGEGYATIRATHGLSVNTLDGGNSLPVVEIYGVRFLWGNSTNQDADKSAIANMGIGSRIINCTFEKDAGSNKSFYNGIGWEYTGTSQVLIEGCIGDVAGCLIMGSKSTPPVTNLLTDSIVRNCRAVNTTGAVSTQFAFDLAGAGNIIENCRADSSAGNGFNNGYRIGDRGKIDKCWVYGTTLGYGYLIQTNDAGVNNSATVVNSVAENSYTGFGAVTAGTFTTRRVHGLFQGNRAQGNQVGFSVINNATAGPDGCSYKLVDNTIDGISGVSPYGMYFSNARSVLARGNKFLNISGPAIYVADNTSAKIVENDIDGFFGNAIWIASTAAGPTLIQGNRIRAAGAATTDTMLQIDYQDAKIVGNQFIVSGGETCAYCVATGVSFVEIKDNLLVGFGTSTGGGNFINATNASGTYRGGLVIRGNTFRSPQTAMVAVGTFGYSVTIEGNYFDSGLYQAIKVVPNGTTTCHGSIVRGNVLQGVSGWRGGSANAVAIEVGGGSAYAQGLLVEGNTLTECGSASDVYSLLVLVEGSGAVRGNTFVEFFGYMANPSGSFCIPINVNSTGWTVEGNKFIKAVTPLMPRQLWVINSEDLGNVIINNHLVLTGDLSGWTNGVFRFINADGQDNTTCSGNILYHTGGTLAGSGISAMAIQVDGDYCLVACNRLQQYDVKADGDYSVVVANQVIDGDIAPNGAHTTFIGNSIPNGTFTTTATMHPEGADQYSSSTLYPLTDMNHASGT